MRNMAKSKRGGLSPSQRDYESKLRAAETFSLLQDVLVHKDLLLTSTNMQDFERTDLIWSNIANKLTLAFNKKRTVEEVKKEWSDLHFIGSEVLRNHTSTGFENVPYMPLLLVILKSVNRAKMEHDDINLRPTSSITCGASGGSRGCINVGTNNNSTALQPRKKALTTSAQQPQCLSACTTKAVDVTDLELPQELTELLDNDFQLGQVEGNKPGECEGRSSFSGNVLQDSACIAASSQPISISLLQSGESEDTKSAPNKCYLEGNHEAVQGQLRSRHGTSHSKNTCPLQNVQLVPGTAMAPLSSETQTRTIFQRSLLSRSPQTLGLPALPSGSKEGSKKELEVLTLKRKYLELKLKTLDSREELLKKSLKIDIKQET